MGRVRTSRRRCSKNKEFKKHHDTKRRKRDIDQIQDDIIKEKETGENTLFEISDDLPGLGQFYCVCCARHFHDSTTLAVHTITKDHKRRLKDVAQKQFSQKESDWAAGKTKELLPPVNKKVM